MWLQLFVKCSKITERSRENIFTRGAVMEMKLKTVALPAGAIFKKQAIAQAGHRRSGIKSRSGNECAAAKTSRVNLLSRIFIGVVALAGGLLFFRSSQAGFTFSDPNIPDGEMLTYASTTDGVATDIVEKTVIKKTVGREFYEITSNSAALDIVIRIERQSMAVLSVEQVKKFNEVILASKIDVTNLKPNASPAEVKLVHYITLKYLMRGFPFAEGARVRIGYYGESENSKFSMSLTCTKKETIKVRREQAECYHLEFGLDGFLGTFFPTTHLWYSAEPPHRLVKYKGTNGPVGAPESVVELVGRTVMAK